jgi:hypothetical protein
MPMLNVLSLLDELKHFGLGDPLFQNRLHHRAASCGTMADFRAYAGKVGFFQKHGCNRLLQDRLNWILAKCKEGAMNRGQSMGDLVDEAKRAIPCHSYSNCKKHVSDQGCKAHS